MVAEGSIKVTWSGGRTTLTAVAGTSVIMTMTGTSSKVDIHAKEQVTIYTTEEK